MNGFGNTPLRMGDLQGNFKNGQKHGFGLSTFKNGSVYEDNSLKINLKEKESCLFETERFIRDYLKMVKSKGLGFVRAKEKNLVH